jgi:small multidrug resistance pump
MVIAVALLMTAIGCEVGATAVIPRTDSFHNLGWSVLVVLGYAVATWLLSVVVKTLPLGVTYATWAGLGTVLVAIVGILFQGESISPLKAGAIGLIVAGVIALNLGASTHA